jgi:hypothetical protein
MRRRAPIADSVALAHLGPGPGDCTGATISDEVLTTGVKSGYKFTYTPGAPGGAGIPSTYSILAPPFSVSVTGPRAFCSMQDGVIHYNDGGTAVTRASMATPLWNKRNDF